ncbi:hypothetical protein ABEB36_005672 [Hypothenemus hampei]|uniref:Uncharacterized protein n=1 Tax=Hypothenemus hampei TaxID=57062 RepID=A0ABD1EZ20_HYPHA
MSCRENCGSLNNATSKSQNAFSRTAPPPSHRPVHIAIERSPDQMVSNLSEYSGYGNLRTPPATRASTPGPYGYPCQFDTFGSQIADYNLSWMPKDIDLSELLNHNGQIPSRFRRADQRVSVIVPNATPPPTVSTPLNANPLLEKEQERDQLTPQMKKNERERRESLMEWFDRSIEKELKKHRSSSFLATPYSHPVSPTAEPQLNLSKGTLERLSGATASQIEMCLDLRKEPDTELVDAVEKFATAEARCAFAGAVKAAEAAAVAAPPDLVEEAALASARGFQTDIKASSVQGELQGLRPVEVLGYIGVTNPKYPTKRE